jgi:acetyl esterase/lipase
MGHSAGAQLALWLASRSSLPENTSVSSLDPLAIHGVLALAPAADLEFLHEEKVCGNVIDKLMGGSPKQHPNRYRWVDPTKLVFNDVSQILIIVKYDHMWTPVGLRYFHIAKTRGDNIQKFDALKSGHFDMIDPDSTSWNLVYKAVTELLGENVN